MRQRFENISIIESLFGLSKEIVLEITGWRGNSYEDYNDNELELIANEQLNIDDEMTKSFCDYHDKIRDYRF